MENKVCFMFGHATTPSSALPELEAAAERHYLDYGIRTYMVGSRGSFDRMAATAIKSLKKRHSDITLTLLLAYHPAERPVEPSPGFDGTYYPLEKAPKRYAIVKANQFMVQNCDTIICYVKNPGNTRNLLEYAIKRVAIPIENISEWPHRKRNNFIEIY